MSDLISRKALLEIFNHDLACFETGSKTEKEIYISVADMRKMIEEQPTAYNVEKVVQQLEDTKCEYEQLANNPFTNMEWQEDIELLAKAEMCEYALEIVRNGGKE